MKLIVGGMAQGKTAYLQKMAPRAVQNMADGREWDWTSGEKPAAISHLEELIRRLLAEQEEPIAWLERYVKGSPKTLFLCTEVGSGIVPMKREERDWRETVGRACCMLAKQADCVVRVSCGIGIVIKGEWQ